MATVSLRKGQRVDLAKGISTMKIVLKWKESREIESWDLDIMGIETNDDQLIANNDPRRLVYYNNLTDPDKALVHMGDDKSGHDGEEMRLTLSKIDQGVKEVIFLLNIFESVRKNQNFGKIKGITMRIFFDNSTIPDLMYNLEDDESHNTATVLKVCSIYRSNGIWKVKAINEGVTSTLSNVLTNYGLESDDNSI